MSNHIDVRFEAMGHWWRVVGHFFPSRPARVSGPPEHCHPAEAAEWLNVEVFLVSGGYQSPDLSEFLSDLCAPGTSHSALDHIYEMAEQAWLDDRNAIQEEAAV